MLVDHRVSDDSQTLDTALDFCLKEKRLSRRVAFVCKAELVMPFGKYHGVPIYKVPLRYLSDTVCSMPENWLVLLVREIINSDVVLIALETGLPQFLPDATLESSVLTTFECCR